MKQVCLFLVLGLLPLFSTASETLDEQQTLALLVRTLDKTDDASVRVSLMRGMLSGLAGRRSVPAPDQWNRVSRKLAASKEEAVRDLSQQLSQIFGDQEAVRRAIETVRNRSAEIEARRSALQSLLNQQNEQVGGMLVALLDEPSLRLEAIRGFASIEHPEAGEVLLGRYDRWNPELRRAVIETLATRKVYAQSLLTAIEKKKVSRDDIPAHVARSLNILLGNSFVEIFGDVRQLAEDREKMMAKYKKLITDDAIADADASRGRKVFEKTCAACHLLYGAGGKIGPDLTGSNRANLDYILLNSVDPSYDVPDGYKMVLIQTIDGRLLSGVIAEEDNRRVVLKTVEQPTVVIAKEDIEDRKVSAKSMMPDGQLDQLKHQEVFDLIKYLRTTQQVEAAK